jgi:hypothetical protein
MLVSYGWLMDELVIYEEHHLDGYTQQLGNWGFGIELRCSCPEFQEIILLTTQPFCKHVKVAALGLAKDYNPDHRSLN